MSQHDDDIADAGNLTAPTTQPLPQDSPPPSSTPPPPYPAAAAAAPPSLDPMFLIQQLLQQRAEGRKEERLQREADRKHRERLIEALPKPKAEDKPDSPTSDSHPKANKDTVKTH